MLPKKRQSKSKVGRHRSHQALKKRNILACGACSGPILPHRSCPQCGHMPQKAQKSAPTETVSSPTPAVEKTEKSVESEKTSSSPKKKNIKNKKSSKAEEQKKTEE